MQGLPPKNDEAESSDCLRTHDEESEEESLEPLSMPLDISNAPSLALPDNFRPLEPSQDEQRQGEMLHSTTFGDQRDPLSQAGFANGILEGTSPAGGFPVHQHQQQHILRPHRGPQLDYWQPQASDSQLLSGDPAQQVAQWQLQQQWQQQQQLQPLLQTGGRSMDHSPLLPHDVGRGAVAGSPRGLHAHVHHPNSPQGAPSHNPLGSRHLNGLLQFFGMIAHPMHVVLH